MGALEQIIQLRNQGISDEDITKTLQNGGVSPKDINDGFNQAQIKNAVSDESPENPANIPPSPEILQQPPQSNEIYSPNAQTIPEEQEMYYPQPQQGQLQEQEDYYSPGEFDTSTIIEISEQVFSEKIQTLQKKIEENAEFKVLAGSKIDNLLERIKNIEKIIDNLQMSILKKVGSYGGNLENIKNEMSMMQDSFRKMISPKVKSVERKSIQKKQVRKTRKIKSKKILRKN